MPSKSYVLSYFLVIFFSYIIFKTYFIYQL